jgi:hypothetical protein
MLAADWLQPFLKHHYKYQKLTKCIVDHLNTFMNDIYQTIGFYKHPGFNLISTVPEQGNYIWAMLTSEDVTFMFQTLQFWR